MIPYFRPKRSDLYTGYPRVNCLKTIPFTTAHTYIAHTWQYMGICVNFVEAKIRKNAELTTLAEEFRLYANELVDNAGWEGAFCF